METRYLVLIGLAVLSLPLDYLLFRLLFGKEAKVADLLDRDSRRESGGGGKLALLLFAAALLVLFEYTLVLALFPALSEALSPLTRPSPLPLPEAKP